MERLKVLLACPFQDNQSGVYIHDSLIQLGCKVAYFDWRKIQHERGIEYMNEQFIEAHKKLTPNVTLIIKGLGIKPETIDEIRKNCDTKIIGWIFDVTLGGTLVKDCADYVSLLKKFDKFYTIDNDAITELKELGVNAYWLTEGCYSMMHKEQILNSVQKRKYGADVVFIGSLGSIHTNREKILTRLIEEGINVKVYGEVYYTADNEPSWLHGIHTGLSVINEMHSTVVNSSKIVLGIDGWPDRSKSWSARLQRTLCAGGFYLTTHTKDIEQHFVPGKHLDTYKTDDEMVEKMLYWLQHDKEREEIAKAGQNLVLEKYNFIDSLQTIFDNLDGVERAQL